MNRRPAVTPAPPAAARVRQRGRTVAVLALTTTLLSAGLATLTLSLLTSRYTIVVPGPVYSADALAGSADGHGDPLLVTSVVSRTPSALELARSWLKTGRSSVRRTVGEPAAAGGPGPTSGQFAASRKRASMAAHRCLGMDPSGATLGENSLPGLGGPSGGLMMALAHVQALRGRPLADVRLAGTGSITSDGTVHEVEGVALKVQAASQAEASVFLVPRTQMAEAARTSGDLRVIGVRTLNDALVALGAAGCRGTDVS